MNKRMHKIILVISLWVVESNQARYVPHRIKRCFIWWGTFGKEGHKFRWVRLPNMSNEHLESIIKGSHGSDMYRKMFEQELLYMYASSYQPVCYYYTA